MSALRAAPVLHAPARTTLCVFAMTVSRFLCCAALFSIVGCDAHNDVPDATVVRDSAGIRIVENHEPTWTEERAWRIPEEPVLTIGVTEGEEAYLLDRVSTALRSGSGDIVVANGGTDELRFYDADGRHFRTIGGQGQGPGEFGHLTFVGLVRNDSILVYDLVLARYTIFSGAGDLGRVFPRPIHAQPFGVLADGSVLLPARLRRHGRPEGIVMDSSAFVRMPADGARLDTIARVADYEIFVGLGDAEGVGLPFPRFSRKATTRDGFVVGMTDRYQIARYDADGTLRYLIRRQVAQRPMTSAERDSVIAEWARAVPDRNREAWDRAVAQQAAIWPVYSAFHVDDADHLWVAEGPYSASPRRWTVYDAEGILLGDVIVPPTFRITHIGDDFVLGITRDEMRVQRVVMYRLIKPT